MMAENTTHKRFFRLTTLVNYLSCRSFAAVEENPISKASNIYAKIIKHNYNL
jgi:hypothetical protein